jgi:hypothetical protein
VAVSLTGSKAANATVTGVVAVLLAGVSLRPVINSSQDPENEIELRQEYERGLFRSANSVDECNVPEKGEWAMARERGERDGASEGRRAGRS